MKPLSLLIVSFGLQLLLGGCTYAPRHDVPDGDGDTEDEDGQLDSDPAGGDSTDVDFSDGDAGGDPTDSDLGDGDSGGDPTQTGFRINAPQIGTPVHQAASASFIMRGMIRPYGAVGGGTSQSANYKIVPPIE